MTVGRALENVASEAIPIVFVNLPDPIVQPLVWH